MTAQTGLRKMIAAFKVMLAIGHRDNLATLGERLPAPCLGRVPHLGKATAAAVAEHLNLELLADW